MNSSIVWRPLLINPRRQRNHTRSINGLICDNIETDSEYEGDEEDDPLSDLTKPWRGEFLHFLNAKDVIPENMGIVEWWGVHVLSHFFYIHSQKNKEHLGTYGQTWMSIVHDYLPIMASSVSSKQAFSSAGITISKQHNQLKLDIIESLQCLKCLYKNDLIFRDMLLSSTVEKDLDGEEILDLDFRADEIVTQADDFSWDQLVLDGDEDDIV